MRALPAAALAAFFMAMCLPARADSMCITASEYLTMRAVDFHGDPVPALGDMPGVAEIDDWRFDFEESFFFVDLFQLPFQAERFSFYGTPGGQTVVIAGYWSGCLVAAIEISKAEAAEIVEMVKGGQS